VVGLAVKQRTLSLHIHYKFRQVKVTTVLALH